MLVGRRMTPNPITVTPETSLAEASNRMKSDKVRRFPVVTTQGRLVGIVSKDDLLHASPSGISSLSIWEMTYLLSKVKVQDVMTRKVITVAEDTPLEEAARIMLENKIGGLPVMRGEALVGIITESDIFRVFTEVLGGTQPGVRLTVLAPNVKGSLAKISNAIFEQGGWVAAFNIFEGEDTSNWGAHIKVREMNQEQLLAAIKPLVLEILDIREIS